MQFKFDFEDLFDTDSDGIAILDVQKMNPSGAYRQTSFYMQSFAPKSTPENKKLAEVLDAMGEASAKAQGLKTIITTYSKFITSEDQRIYIKVDNQKVYGILKVGRKNLFYHDSTGHIKELKPLCLLDFYVHESCQRHGIGKALFNKMLDFENIEPRMMAFDRPSVKLFPFLKKHFNLKSYVPQNNNFVVFNAYFDKNLAAVSSKRSLQQENQQPYSSKPQSAQGNRVNAWQKQKQTYQDNNYHYEQQQMKETSQQNPQQNVNKWQQPSRRQANQKNTSTGLWEVNPDEVKNTCNRTCYQTANSFTSGNKYQSQQKQPKVSSEEYLIQEIESKMKLTEDKLNKCKMNIQSMEQRRDQLPTSANLTKQKKDQQSMNTPWASDTSYAGYTSSSKSYGNHYSYIRNK